MRTLSLLLVIFLASSLFGQNNDHQVEQIAKAYLSPQSPGIGIIIMEKGKVSYRKAFGLSEVSTATPLHPDQSFRIGSLTKQFTAAAILKLAHEEKLSLSDTLQSYLPQIEMRETITLRQLLQHTSGLGNQSDLTDVDLENANTENYPASVLEQFFRVPLRFTPGSAYAYSNLGYIVLGHIVEKVSGLSYEAYLAEHFFEPLNMTHTGFEYLSNYSVDMSQGHSFWDDHYQEAAPLNMKIPFSGGGLVSTLDDLARWNAAIMSGKVLPISMVEEISRSSILATGQETGYSMGWQIGNVQGLKSVKHDGIVNGYTSMALYLPEQEIFVAVLSNCDCYRDIEIPATKIAAVIAERPFATQAIEISQIDVQAIQGTYRHQDQEMHIVLQAETLMYYRTGGTKTPLVPVNENTFRIAGSLDQLEFTSQENDESYTLRTLHQTSQWEKVAPLTAYQPKELSDTEQGEFVGRYQVQDKFVFEVFQVGQELFGKIGNDQKSIRCFGPDQFYAVDTDAELTFSRDETGQVSQLSLQTDIEFVAQKLP